MTINLLCLYDVCSFLKKKLMKKSSRFVAFFRGFAAAAAWWEDGSAALHGVHGRTAVFVPQVDGFGHDGVRVLLRHLRGEASVSFDAEGVRGPERWRRGLTLLRNLDTPSGRLRPSSTIL